MKALTHSGKIAHVPEGTLAKELGLAAGDRILEVNGQKLSDIIDLSFAMAEEEIELLVEKADGERETIAFDKDYDEELGAQFESAVFDGIRRCGNRCWFCFVDQIAPGMRKSLSVKDDDYRMSFLYGNFVTLTNLREADLARIRRLHLSPLFVSVHATDGALRARMLENKRAARIMEQLEALLDAGVELHTQVVLCPEVNDGAALERTVGDLAALRPGALSLAIVPVGLTRYRENCHALRKFTRAEAAAVIDFVEARQRKYRAETGRSFVYLGDEFYFLAGRALPEDELYDGYPQLENGIGLTRNFLAEWQAAAAEGTGAPGAPRRLDVVCGVSAAEVLRPLVAPLAASGAQARVLAVENRFFGSDITVSGLLTGGDILAALEAHGGGRDGVVVPAAALRADDAIFLDDLPLTALEKRLGVPVRAAASGGELHALLTNWPEARN